MRISKSMSPIHTDSFTQRTFQLLINVYHKCCRAGSIIKEIREASGAFIKILPAEELPACALSNDRVVQ